MSSYWEERKEYNYYKHIINLLNSYTKKFGQMQSILDVGCSNTPIVMYGDFKERTSIDINNRPDIYGVKKIIGDFMKEKFRYNFSVVMCLQTIEHVKEPEKFIEKLFSISSKFLIISLPINWNPIKYHVSNNITESTVYKWTKTKPSLTEMVSDAGHIRGIFEYDIERIRRDNRRK